MREYPTFQDCVSYLHKDKVQHESLICLSRLEGSILDSSHLSEKHVISRVLWTGVPANDIYA